MERERERERERGFLDFKSNASVKIYPANLIIALKTLSFNLFICLKLVLETKVNQVDAAPSTNSYTFFSSFFLLQLSHREHSFNCYGVFSILGIPWPSKILEF